LQNVKGAVNTDDGRMAWCCGEAQGAAIIQ
jgi:hypothetical protein